MPDESTAATEHALLQEITAPLATLPEDAVPEVAEVDFPVALRGYDRMAVDAYVKRTSQLVAELQATRSPEAAVRRGLERVGEEVSGILQRSHEAASELTAQSRREAEGRLERARQEATQITAAAERRLQELDAETDRIWAERQRIVEDAQQLAGQLLALAQSAAERFPAAEEPETTQEGPARPVRAGRPGLAELADEPAEAELEGPPESGGPSEHAESSNGMVEGGSVLADDADFDATTEPDAAPFDQLAGDRSDEDSTRVMPPLRPPGSVPPPEEDAAS